MKLADLGFWSTEHHSFFSPLLLRVVLKKFKAVQLEEPRVMMIKRQAEDHQAAGHSGPLRHDRGQLLRRSEWRGEMGQVDHVFNGVIDVAVDSVFESSDSMQASRT